MHDADKNGLGLAATTFTACSSLLWMERKKLRKLDAVQVSHMAGQLAIVQAHVRTFAYMLSRRYQVDCCTVPGIIKQLRSYPPPRGVMWSDVPDVTFSSVYKVDYCGESTSSMPDFVQDPIPLGEGDIAAVDVKGWLSIANQADKDDDDDDNVANNGGEETDD